MKHFIDISTRNHSFFSIWFIHCIYSFRCSSDYMRGSRKFCQRGPNFENLFFSLMSRRRNKILLLKRSIIGPPAKRRLNGVSQACRWCLYIESWLGSFVILRGSGPVLLKKLYFCDFPGGGSDPLHPPPPSLEPRMDCTCYCFPFLYGIRLACLSIFTAILYSLTELDEFNWIIHSNGEKMMNEGWNHVKGD